MRQSESFPPRSARLQTVMLFCAGSRAAVRFSRVVMSSTQAMPARTAEVSRKTAETDISVAINLDGTGVSRLESGIGFLDHMLEQIARHGLIDMDIRCQGDLHIDGHHTVEDIGITFGQAVARAVGDKKGLRRYGHAYVPLDEALSRVVIDLSGRPGLTFEVPFTAAMIGQLDTQLVYEFFQGFVNHAPASCPMNLSAGSSRQVLVQCGCRLNTAAPERPSANCSSC